MQPEHYLRRFLSDSELPLDNNDAERSIKASALLYSITETSKANNLKPYEYFRYLLTELVKYPRENVPEEVLVKLMPWSDTLPDCCRKTKSR